jgi:hypothetical protein
MRSDITPGSTLPPYELPDHETIVRLRQAWDADEHAPFHGWDEPIAAIESAA